MLNRRLSFSDRYYIYNVAKHNNQINLWIDYISGIPAKGTVLMIVYEKYRAIQVPSLEQFAIKNTKYLNQEYKSPTELFKKKSSTRGVLAYPSAQTLLKEAGARHAEESLGPYTLYAEDINNEENMEITTGSLRSDTFTSNIASPDSPIRHCITYT
jgi:hypothetical protein